MACHTHCIHIQHLKLRLGRGIRGAETVVPAWQPSPGGAGADLTNSIQLSLK